jgi:hypothetical protein
MSLNPKYFVVLFKNKVRKKIIKKFSNYNNAKKFFEEQVTKSSEVIFEKKFINGSESQLEIGLLGPKSQTSDYVYVTDELGRNIRVKFEDESNELMKVVLFKEEERIYDVGKEKKITTPEFIKSYLKGDGLKMISTLNNKIVVQKDEDVNLFSLKSPHECQRFVDCLSKHFYNQKRKDCMFVSDTDTAQKKYLLKLLNEMGFDKKVLYRQFTTYPRST